MHFQFYLEKLHNSEQFKEFLKKHPKSYFCSGFFSIDKKGKDNQSHLDFYDPDEKKIYSFQLEKEDFKPNPLEDYDKRIPEPLELEEKFNFDFNDIEDQITKRMKKEKMKKEIEKSLFSFQSLKKEKFLIGTIFISGLGLLKVKFDLKKNKITEFEKKSFFDMLKIVKRNKK